MYISFILFLKFNILFSVYNWFVLIIFFFILFFFEFLHLGLNCFFVIYLFQYKLFIIKSLRFLHFQSLIHRSSILTRKFKICFVYLFVIIITIFIPWSITKLLSLMGNSLIWNISQLISDVLLRNKNSF